MSIILHPLSLSFVHFSIIQIPRRVFVFSCFRSQIRSYHTISLSTTRTKHNYQNKNELQLLDRSCCHCGHRHCRPASPAFLVSCPTSQPSIEQHIPTIMNTHVEVQPSHHSIMQMNFTVVTTQIPPQTSWIQTCASTMNLHQLTWFWLYFISPKSKHKISVTCRRSRFAAYQLLVKLRKGDEIADPLLTSFHLTVSYLRRIS